MGASLDHLWAPRGRLMGRSASPARASNHVQICIRSASMLPSFSGLAHICCQTAHRKALTATSAGVLIGCLGSDNPDFQRRFPAQAMHASQRFACRGHRIRSHNSNVVTHFLLYVPVHIRVAQRSYVWISALNDSASAAQFIVDASPIFVNLCDWMDVSSAQAHSYYTT